MRVEFFFVLLAASLRHFLKTDTNLGSLTRGALFTPVLFTCLTLFFYVTPMIRSFVEALQGFKHCFFFPPDDLRGVPSTIGEFGAFGKFFLVQVAVTFDLRARFLLLLFSDLLVPLDNAF